ncbi:MAG: PPC domain-containing protein, partial [Polyangiaceae bacterium]|nr:PPC domain-containing protein [Polyangiaceae bacterium]
DADTTEVTIGQDEPVIPGSKLDQHSEFEATWSWCPSKEQIAEAERYVVKLFADDGENDKVTKPFLVVLWDKSSPQACSDAAFGTPPVIKHQAEDRQTIKDITLTAEVTDDLGISSAPFLFYATEEPENPPERMMMLQMKLGSGDRKSGTWTAVVPNPVAAKSAGSSAQLYYFIAAQDDDDKKGDCDNLTVAPNQGTYAITVTNSGGSGTLGVCEPCSADAQCGSDAGLCTRMGSASNSYCLRECSGPQDCTEPGYYCSVLKHESVDGTSARQCFPTDLECEIGGAGTCQDDNWEENDTLEEANLGPSFETKNHTGLVSCPGPSGTPDDDFYWLDVPQGGAITATLNGSKETDLDLMLLNGAGAIYAESNGLASSEVVSACVPAGVYYLRVYSLGFERNTYDLSYELGTCAACHDDPSEPDGNPDKARRVDLSTGPYKSETDAICANNEDWFRVPLSKGQTLYATLTFSRGNASDDLDLLLFRESTLLTQCTEAQPGGCDPSNGQGVEENESMVWPVQADGTYYVVARGWAGSENLYDICIGLSRAACPVPE